MTDLETFVSLLTAANIPFLERKRKSRSKERVLELDNGGGAVASFTFNAEGVLEEFDIDKDAY